jgi:RNA polymerase sigma-70 factor (ECF subfamily)
MAPIDSSLVQRAQAREAEAIAELLRRARPLVERTVGRLCHDRELAEDLVQTCLLIVLTRLPGLRTPEAFVGWAQSIVRNVCRKEFDRQARRRAAMARVMWHRPDLWSGDVGVVDPEELALRSEVRVHLDRVLKTLPDRYRSVVTLRALYGYSYDEIGQLLHAPGELVRLWHFRSRQYLQALCRTDEVLVRGVSPRAKLAPAPEPSPTIV